MKTQRTRSQIVIKTKADDEKQMLPMHMMLTLAAGAIAGVAMIFAFFWGIEKLLGM